MNAISFAAFGGPEVLTPTELPVPDAGPGQVRIRVRTAGVNPVDAKIREGRMEQLFPTALPSVPGLELGAGAGDSVSSVAGVSSGPVETPAYQRSSGALARVACRPLLVFVQGVASRAYRRGAVAAPFVEERVRA